MKEKFTVVQQNESLANRRLLTEVNNLLIHRQPDGTYPQGVLGGTEENLVTKVKEDTFANAVSRTFQPKGEYTDEQGNTTRMLQWKGLGMTLLQVADSGYKYHRTEAAFGHVRFHKKEAIHAEEKLRYDMWQVMVEPKLSHKDASRQVALDEHMADTDAIRTSHAVVDEDGNIIGRQMVALLVSNVPLIAWVAMLRDPHNPWGRAFDINDPDSSLGVMGLFDQLDLPLGALSEGPVSLVEAVSPYVTDSAARKSVHEQLVGFRQDQQKLDVEARRTAKVWLEFEKALADSLAHEKNVMHKDVRIFAVQHQNQWPRDVLAMLKERELPGGHYRVDVELAAVLEQAWQKIHLAESAVMAGDKKALKNLSANEIKQLQTDIKFVRMLEQSGFDPAQVQAARANLNRVFATKDITTGGGCSGVNKFKFKGINDMLGMSFEDGSPLTEMSLQEPAKDDEEGVGDVHDGVCRTGICPSGTEIVEVGGCEVCLEHCQPIYNDGNDPLEVFANSPVAKKEAQSNRLADLGIRHLIRTETQKPKERELVTA